VLLLGDSISIGYTPEVQSSLAGEAVVMRPTRADGRPENCEGTTRGVAELKRWLQLGDGEWEVIHFNFGLHDIKRVDPVTGRGSNDPTYRRQASPRLYELQLRAIVRRLQATGAVLIFATTTPVPPGGVKPHRDEADPARYNEIALRIMTENGVQVNDLYAVAEAKCEEIQQPVNVHFTPEGSKLLGEVVTDTIRQALRQLD